MIEVLSSPTNQVGFSLIDNKKPYFSKYNTPIAKIEYCNTVFNTRHNGITTEWRTKDDNDNVSNSYSGRTPHVKFYSGRSIPSAIINYNEGDGWQVGYSGYFKAPISADYSFYFAGDGKITSNTHAMDGDISTDRINIDSAAFVEKGPYSLTEGNYYALALIYEANRDNTDAGFIGMWQTDSASYTPERVVISGDVLKPVSDSSTPQFESIKSYSNISFRENETNSEFTFEVPFVSTASYNYGGYRYKSTTDSYVDIDSGQELKEYRMIRYSEGYRYSNGDEEYVERFTGQIRDISISYKPDGNDSLKITCYDYSIFTKDTINFMSPTPIDYWQAGYIDEFPGRYNGIVKPRCFDGWDVHKAYQVILTECGISPFSFIGKKSFGDYDSAAVDGGFNIEPLSLYTSDTASIPYFHASNNYGIPPIGEVDVRADDEYIYPISTGEYYRDALDQFMKPWYYKWGFDQSGFPFLKRINAPFDFINDREFNLDGTWSEEINVNALKGTYIETELADQTASCDATGKKIALLCGCGPLCGSSLSTEQTFNVVVRHGSDVLVDTNYNAYDPSERFYFDGANKNNGVNPCILKIANGLPYDTYRVVVKSIDYKTRIEGIMCYDEEYETPKETYYTSDQSGDATIVQLDFEKDIEDHRTDCVVLGRRTGTIFKTTEEGEEITVNRNNPVHTYIQSAARDLRSVYSHTASNYIGRPRTTLIIDPSIVSQEQADYISFSVVDSYNEPLKQVGFEMVGNPAIQVNDCIAVVEDYKNGITENDYLWITEVENSFNKNGYKTRVRTTPIPPVDSFWERPAIDVENEYDGHYIWNLSVKNSGYVGYLTSGIYPADSANANIFINKDLTEDALEKMIPYTGYARIGQEIIRYDSADISGSDIRLHDITRRIQAVDTPSFLTHVSDSNVSNSQYTGSMVVIGHNPYSVDSWPSTIEFDLLSPSSVRINVKNYIMDNANNRTHKISEFVVDSLTKVEEDPTEGNNYRDLKPGHYKFAWGGLDRIGAYNNSVKLTDEASMFGSDFYARENFSVVDHVAIPVHSGGEYRVEPTYEEYVFDTGYGQFYGDISVIVQGKKLPKQYKTTSKESYVYEHTTYSLDRTGIAKQILCDPGIIDLKFSTSGLYFASVEGSGFNGLAYLCKGFSEDSLMGTSYLNSATNYPVNNVSGGGADGYSYNGEIPVFMINNSNTNSYGVPQGLKFTIDRIDDNVDSGIIREYLPTMKFRFVQIGGYYINGTGEGSVFRGFEPIVHEGVLNEDSELQMLHLGREYYFNLNRWCALNDIEYLPTKWIDSFVSAKNEPNYEPEYSSKMFTSNYIIFSNDILDMSGRKPKQARYFNSYDGNLYVDIDLTGLDIYSLLDRRFLFGDVYNTLKDENKTPYKFLSRDGNNNPNRGFYEFYRSKQPYNGGVYIKYTAGTPDGPEERKELLSFPFGKNSRDEIRPSPIYQYNRSNFAVWYNEDYVRRVLFWTGDYDYESWHSNINFYKKMDEFYRLEYGDIYVPRIFFEWRHEDF